MVSRWVIGMIVVMVALGQVVAQEVINADQLDKKSMKLYKKAKKLSKTGETQKAIDLFEKLLDREPTLLDAYLSLGGLHYRQEAYEEAINYFERAATMTPSELPELDYALATSYEELEQYAAAASAYDRYLAIADSTEQKYGRAKLHSRDMHFAAEATANPVPFDPHIISGVSSVYTEYMPVVRGDGDEMIFIRRTRNQEDLYTARRIDDTTFAAQVPIAELNTKGNEGIHSISADGRILVFTACGRMDGYGQCDLYYSKREGDSWSRPINMGKRVNSASTDSGPSLTADGRGLYFGSDRIGGVGGKDIYYTQLKADGTWYRPVNIGAAVNTPMHEEAPFIHQDGVTLYFRSNGRAGMGGFDIYYSRWQKEEGWSTPTNMGYPINTKGSEGGLTVSLDGRTAYYASDRDDLDQVRRDLDIYRFALPEAARPQHVTFVRGRVTDASTSEGLPATLVLHNVTEDKLRQRVNTDNEGYYFVALPVGQAYSFTAEKEGYLFYSEHYQLDSAKTAVDPFRLDIALSPVPEEDDSGTTIDAPVVLNNMFFATGSAELQASSQQEVQRLIDILVQYPDKSMVIVGHTDIVGQPADNRQLSRDRAHAVRLAILAGGVAADRVRALGLGESQPIADNSTEQGQQRNRRVEFYLE